MVISVIPIRWVRTACWLGRGRSRTNDCALATDAHTSKPSITSRARTSNLDTEASSSEFQSWQNFNGPGMTQNVRLEAAGLGWLAEAEQNSRPLAARARRHRDGGAAK